MKNIKISKDLETLVSNEDFNEVSQFKWSAYQITGTSHTGKVYYYGYKVGRKIQGKRIWLHNFIMEPSKDMFIDHINGDPLDNRRENLRIVTHRENTLNRGKRSNGKTSQFLGVSLTKHRNFRAGIKVNNKNINLGHFKSEIEAAKAYNNAALLYFGKFARLNKI